MAHQGKGGKGSQDSDFSVDTRQEVKKATGTNHPPTLSGDKVKSEGRDLDKTRIRFTTKPMGFKNFKSYVADFPRGWTNPLCSIYFSHIREFCTATDTKLTMNCSEFSKLCYFYNELSSGDKITLLDISSFLKVIYPTMATVVCYQDILIDLIKPHCKVEKTSSILLLRTDSLDDPVYKMVTKTLPFVDRQNYITEYNTSNGDFMYVKGFYWVQSRRGISSSGECQCKNSKDRLLDLFSAGVADEFCAQHRAAARADIYNAITLLTKFHLMDKPQLQQISKTAEAIPDSWEDIFEDDGEVNDEYSDIQVAQLIKETSETAIVPYTTRWEDCVDLYFYQISKDYDGEKYLARLTETFLKLVVVDHDDYKEFRYSRLRKNEIQSMKFTVDDSRKESFYAGGPSKKQPFFDISPLDFRWIDIWRRPQLPLYEKAPEPQSFQGKVHLSDTCGGYKLSTLLIHEETITNSDVLLGDSIVVKRLPNTPITVRLLRSYIDDDFAGYLQLCYPEFKLVNLRRYAHLISEVMRNKRDMHDQLLRRSMHHGDSWVLRKTPKVGFSTIFHNPRNLEPVRDDLWKRLVQDDHRSDLLFKNTRTKLDIAWTQFRSSFSTDPNRGIKAHKMDLLRPDEETGRRGERYNQGKVYDMVEFKRMLSPSSLQEYINFERDHFDSKGYKEKNHFDKRRICEKNVAASIEAEYALVDFYSWETDEKKILGTSVLRDSKRHKHVHELRAFAARGGVRRKMTKMVSLGLYKELMATRYVDTHVNRDAETQRNMFKSASRGLMANIMDDKDLSISHKSFVADNTIELCMAAWNEAVSINRGTLSKNF